MLSNLSLRSKLSIYVGAAITAAVSLCILLFVLHATTRIRTELDSAVRLANDFIIGSLATIQESDHPDDELRKVITEANNSRHIWAYSEKIAYSKHATPNNEAPPSWFSSIFITKNNTTEIDLKTASAAEDKIFIEANPSDEISEIWAEIKWISLSSLAVIMVTTLIISIVVSRTLSPVEAYVDALNKLGSGERNIQLSSNGSPEFRIISERINTLAKTLLNLDNENHHLIQKMMKLQDNERKELARDLHDEFGPALFMSRVGIGGLRKKIEGFLNNSSWGADWDTIDHNLDKLQQINRRILGRLRPAALEDMGLSGAIEAMAQSWRKTNPHIELNCYFPIEKYKLDENQSLAAYRIIQEALTNIYRHSGATKANVKVEFDNNTLTIEVEDNGVGIGKNPKKGIGLRGMKERMLGVNGHFEVTSNSPSGTRVVASIPHA
jgi:two-component system sensor histidine kinase UhpB